LTPWRPGATSAPHQRDKGIGLAGYACSSCRQQALTGSQSTLSENNAAVPSASTRRPDGGTVELALCL
jgi:hypothetical protein